MKRFVLPIIVIAIALAGTAVGTAATPKLSGVDGPGFTITIKSGGKLVKTLTPGTYTLAVADKSSLHNFHLFGPGVNKKTTVPFTGVQTWTVKLKAGTYTYQCDIHAAAGMKGTFKVT
ncbi:MAG TPA: plastocyanin/azurin family copper-binding protein [Gaiellaceae bacterium]|nr:plastocyanin/azurin family copper-binding protein [Gaiellaceae bacterium]